MSKEKIKMELQEMQSRIFANKIKHNFNTTEIGPEIIHLAEELGELARAYRDRKHKKVIDAVGDIAVYCIGLFSIIGSDAQEEITKIVVRNEKRGYRKDIKIGR